MEKITAAGGVLSRIKKDGNNGVEVLLIYRLGVWDLPKGKLENGETIEECAKREVREEVGCKYLEMQQKLTTTFHTYRDNGQLIGKTTHWYSMKTDEDPANFKPQKEEGIKKLKWVSPYRAKEMVGYNNLIEVLQTFIKKEGVK